MFPEKQKKKKSESIIKLFHKGPGDKDGMAWTLPRKFYIREFLGGIQEKIEPLIYDK